MEAVASRSWQGVISLRIPKTVDSSSTNENEELAVQHAACPPGKLVVPRREKSLVVGWKVVYGPHARRHGNERPGKTDQPQGVRESSHGIEDMLEHIAYQDRTERLVVAKESQDIVILEISDEVDGAVSLDVGALVL